MKPIFVNNAASLLAVPISAVSTDIQLTAGYGALFPNPSAGEYFSVTLENQQASNREIVRINSRTGDVLHVLQRGAENTTAMSWMTNPPTLVDHRVTAAQLNLLFSLEHSQVTRETPVGLIDGSNEVFTLLYMPEENTESVFLNGIMLEPGVSNDYVVSGSIIMFNYAPCINDRIRVNYSVAL